MAKTDHETFLDELRRKKQEVEDMIRTRVNDLLAQRSAIDDELKELGYSGAPKELGYSGVPKATVVAHRDRLACFGAE